LIVLGVGAAAWADNQQPSPWRFTQDAAVCADVWQLPPESEVSTKSTLSEEVFREPVCSSLPKYHLLNEAFSDPVVKPAGYFDGDRFQIPSQARSDHEEAWSHQVLPDGLIYRSYLAGAKESRFAGQWVHDVDLGWMWDITLGGRVGILRYGTTSVDRPEGWQIDMEGAGMPRLDLEHEERDLIAADFRFGIPLTYGRGNYQMKLAYYHLSSHLGDEYMVRHSTLQRRNYSRDVIVWGHSFFLTRDIRLYGEAGWAFTYDGGTEPWEFQFGLDYSPAELTGQRGSPFVAVNGHLRQEFDFGGNIVVQTGWQWRGYSGHLFRIGMHYFQGMSDQWEFFDQFEDKLGFGLWYDF
jgi:hypothetical protein